MSTRKKSFKKALTWIILDNGITWSIAYLITGKVFVSLGIAIISNTIEILVYYFHERIWDKHDKN